MCAKSQMEVTLAGWHSCTARARSGCSMVSASVYADLSLMSCVVSDREVARISSLTPIAAACVRTPAGQLGGGKRVGNGCSARARATARACGRVDVRPCARAAVCTCGAHRALCESVAHLSYEDSKSCGQVVEFGVGPDEEHPVHHWHKELWQLRERVGRRRLECLQILRDCAQEAHRVGRLYTSAHEHGDTIVQTCSARVRPDVEARVVTPQCLRIPRSCRVLYQTGR